MRRCRDNGLAYGKRTKLWLLRNNMTKIAFICIHNSCRSQIAEALGRHIAGDVFESYSAGTETKPRINPDAVRLMKQLYGIDMEKTQRPKLLSEIPRLMLWLQWAVMSPAHTSPAHTGKIGGWPTRPEKAMKNSSLSYAR
jgi:predicted protein tyrosine phosphatase